SALPVGVWPAAGRTAGGPVRRAPAGVRPVQHRASRSVGVVVLSARPHRRGLPGEGLAPRAAASLAEPPPARALPPASAPGAVATLAAADRGAHTGVCSLCAR